MHSMRSVLLLSLTSWVLACTGSPTTGGEPEPTPTGTILVGTPNGSEAGTYLVDVETGAVTQIAAGGDPLSVAFSGGYSKLSGFVYGLRTQPEPRHIMRVSLAQRDTAILLEQSDQELLVGTFDLNSGETSLAIQTLHWPTGKARLSSVNLDIGAWTPIVDADSRIDALPLTSIKWSPDGTTLYAVTELFPDRSELVRIDLATQLFRVISPMTPISAPLSVDVSPDGGVLAHADGAGRTTFRDTDGNPLQGYPELPLRTLRPTFSPDGKFMAYQMLLDGIGEGPIILMRLSDGKRWPLKINATFTVWLSDWI